MTFSKIFSQIDTIKNVSLMEASEAERHILCEKLFPQNWNPTIIEDR